MKSEGVLGSSMVLGFTLAKSFIKLAMDSFCASLARSPEVPNARDAPVVEAAAPTRGTICAIARRRAIATERADVLLVTRDGRACARRISWRVKTAS